MIMTMMFESLVEFYKSSYGSDVASETFRPPPSSRNI